MLIYDAKKCISNSSYNTKLNKIGNIDSYIKHSKRKNCTQQVDYHNFASKKQG